MNFQFKNLFGLVGKVAVVTGGAGLLGQNFCRGLAEFGANVVIADINKSAVTELAEKLTSEYKVKCIGIPCDVTSEESIHGMVSEVVRVFGGINILLNNAASKADDLDAFFASIENYSLDEWRKIMAVNIDGMFLAAQAVGKQMLLQGQGGSIIQTSSIYGVVGPDNRIYEGSFYLGRKINTPPVYSASKSAVIGLTRYLATAWADKGIRVNTITPGGVKSGQNEEFIARYSDRIPMRRMAKAEEMVGAALYLSSEASSYVTGQNLIIDGGLTAW
ncbi:NAD(P)-dependent dehydrogenase (short-subunit alcohol dehydrogenase family) [Fontibacillus phaseoli]|uniref:NAD(P)-dependent dehydrogenase (Short-subunit alcohol dehydrogenase family) n=1 Tax=Fontibacillus phaseoli TaxID=1416533 RepID=A0A369BC05_9BACL|nr:SDR family oxidoreductase [Fontibacillus phaseoli]RCX19063.1 NAD(P)-dependent dehydrogenase (short-subunit alcohol dehydrogenase family) [Fontibacillus phaseoli]